MTLSAVRPPHAAAAGLLLWAQQTGGISQLLHGQRASAATASPQQRHANAGSAALSADVGS